MSSPSDVGARRQRRPRPVVDLIVQSTEWLSPQMVRLVLGGAGISAFNDNGMTDKYVKIRFPEHDATRTYTVRAHDPAAGTLTIDFVVHGDEGIAGPWAAHVRPGDPVSLMGPGGAHAPDPAVDWYLFAGDASALPAIAATLEALPADAVGIAHLLVEDPGERLDLSAPPGVHVHWHFHAPSGSDPSLLAGALDSGSWLPGRAQVFAHGERESVKAIRAVLKEREVPREDFSLSGYWAYGRTEDRFQAEKREPIGKIPD